MDVTKQIQQLADDLKSDKSIAQPWRNFAVRDALRLLALVEKGKRSTSLTPPPEYNVAQSNSPESCLCSGKKANVNCPVHGINV